MSSIPWTTRWAVRLLQSGMRRVHHQFEAQAREASRVNAETLRALLHHNRDTVFGRRHGFASLRGVAEYQRALPLNDYAFFQPDVERIARGEQGVLTADKVEYLGRTSGTTGEVKLHPITRSYLRHVYRASAVGRDLVFNAVPAAAEPAQGLILINARLNAPTSGGVKTGPLSSITLDAVRQFPGPKLFASPFFVFLLKKPADALYLHLLFGLRDAALGTLQAPYASGLLDLVHLLAQRGPELVEDLGRGGVRPQLELEPEERRLAQKLLRPDPARARAVEAALAGGTRGLARRVWPRLAYASSIAGGSFSLYAQQLAPFLEGIPFYHSTYLSTEAVLGVSLALDSARYCLLPGAAFFEFIPEAQLEEAQPRVLLPEELVLGESYEVVLTTRNGMYRYRLGDVVRVVDRHHEAPVVEVLYRRGTLLNLMGEKTSEHSTRHALAQVLQGEGLHLTDYCVAARIESSPGRYAFFVELAGARAEGVEAERLGTALDAALCQANPAYAFRRRGAQLGAPLLHLVRPGSFQALRELLQRRGGSSSQVKVPRTVRDPELESLLLERQLAPEALRAARG